MEGVGLKETNLPVELITTREQERSLPCAKSDIARLSG